VCIEERQTTGCLFLCILFRPLSAKNPHGYPVTPLSAEGDADRATELVSDGVGAEERQRRSKVSQLFGQSLDRRESRKDEKTNQNWQLAAACGRSETARVGKLRDLVDGRGRMSDVMGGREVPGEWKEGGEGGEEEEGEGGEEGREEGREEEDGVKEEYEWTRNEERGRAG
jgi:hypothetical protein